LLISMSALENYFAIPAVISGRESKIASGLNPQLSVRSNRCTKAYSASSRAKLYFIPLNPSLSHTSERLDRLQDKLTKPLPVRLRFQLPHVAPSSKRSNFLETCSTSAKTAPPTKTPGPHIRCTKTSPQQTDPPKGGSRLTA
jgi:hypothetical protein